MLQNDQAVNFYIYFEQINDDDDDDGVTENNERGTLYSEVQEKDISTFQSPPQAVTVYTEETVTVSTCSQNECQ